MNLLTCASAGRADSARAPAISREPKNMRPSLLISSPFLATLIIDSSFWLRRPARVVRASEIRCILVGIPGGRLTPPRRHHPRRRPPLLLPSRPRRPAPAARASEIRCILVGIPGGRLPPPRRHHPRRRRSLLIPSPVRHRRHASQYSCRTRFSVFPSGWGGSVRCHQFSFVNGVADHRWGLW